MKKNTSAKGGSAFGGKKHFLSFIILLFLFLAQFLLISNIDIVYADDNLLKMVGDGGLDKIGSKAYDQSGEPTDVRTIVVNVIKIFLTLIGIIFLVLILLAGYTWMTAQGNEDKVNEAKTRLKTGVIGLIIIIAAWSITRFVASKIIQSVEETTWPPF